MDPATAPESSQSMTTMAQGSGAKATRTRTGCLTCRKRKVKCDETKPRCNRCSKWGSECSWNNPLRFISQVTPQVIGLPVSTFYIDHFTTYCCRFLAYSNDNEGNPFQEKLIPLASSSPALLHSMTALAAGCLARSQPRQPQHNLAAADHYLLALHDLSQTLSQILSDPMTVLSDATLGACLLLCVYEILYLENGSWLGHLKGARHFMLSRGGSRSTGYLTRFFSFLDVSGSLFSGAGPLLEGNYWLNDEDSSENSKLHRWPYYDADNVVVKFSHELMVHMAELSRLSSKSMGELRLHQSNVAERANKIHDDLCAWWLSCPPSLRDQKNDWRRQTRLQKLTVAETLREEAFSSIRSRRQGCIIYLNHILNPLGREPTKLENTEAIKDILEIAEEILEECGLEMGIYWGLFMAGVAIFDNQVAEDLIRRKLKATSGLWHADRALDLLEVLWKRQHQYSCKFDWREVQRQMGIQM